MKKYLRLTAREAINHFLLGDGSLAPETSDDIRKKLADLNKLKSDISVTIIIPTHRSKPNYDNDRIMLRNKIDAVEEELFARYPKRTVWPVRDNMREAEEMVDNGLNLDSMVLYANEHFSSIVKLPVELPEEISVGEYFDLRPLYKTIQQNRSYYILTVGQQKLRLMEALNDKINREFDEKDFPFIKDFYYEIHPRKRYIDSFTGNKEKEFYNDADKSFRVIWSENPMPLVLAGTVKSVSYYEEQMDDKSLVIARVSGSFDDTTLPLITEAVKPAVELYRSGVIAEHLKDIDAAASADLLVFDFADIGKAIEEGNTATLYIANDYTLHDDIFDPKIRSDEYTEQEMKQKYFQLIRSVAANKGAIVYLEDSVLEKYNGILLVKRY